MSTLLVFSTASSLVEARKLAGLVLNRKLAACVSIQPSMESYYWWKGAREKAKEVLLLIKTEARRYKELERTLKANHSYSVPEIIAVPIQKGSPDYLRWIHETIGE